MRRSFRSIAFTMYALVSLVASVLLASSANSQNSSLNVEDIPKVPERLRYLFDLPWCKKWDLSCLRCEKVGDQISCERLGGSCGDFQQYYCREYKVSEQCLTWYDGCNECRRVPCSPASENCSRISCTARACLNPRPRFVCEVPATNHPKPERP